VILFGKNKRALGAGSLDKISGKAYMNEQHQQICLADSPSINLVA